MGQIGRILYSPECEAEIKERWPDRCPECGCVAWIGLYSVKCVNKTCMHGSVAEHAAYHELIDTDEVKFPGNQLDVERAIANMPVPTFWGKTLNDWHYCLDNDAPIADNGKGAWTYQLPKGESQNCYIGDQHRSQNGLTYAIFSIDRTVDQITIEMDPRVP